MAVSLSSHPFLGLSRSCCKLSVPRGRGDTHDASGSSELMATGLRFPLRHRDPPPQKISLSKLPHALKWESRVGSAPSLIRSPTYAQPWRHEGLPQWALHIKPNLPPRTPFTREEQALVEGVVGQLRIKLAKNLNRTVDTFRQWCAMPSPCSSSASASALACS